MLAHYIHCLLHLEVDTITAELRFLQNAAIYCCLNHRRIYSGPPLIRTSLGNGNSGLLKGVSCFTIISSLFSLERGGGGHILGTTVTCA